MPCRAIWSSMWSREGTPEASFWRPVPSRLSETRICVSEVLRVTSATRMVLILQRGTEGLEKLRCLFGGADRDAQKQLASNGCILPTFLISTLRASTRSKICAPSGTRSNRKLAALGKTVSSACNAATRLQARATACSSSTATCSSAAGLGRHIDVVWRTHLVELRQPFRRAGHVAQADASQAQLDTVRITSRLPKSARRGIQLCWAKGW